MLGSDSNLTDTVHDRNLISFLTGCLSVEVSARDHELLECHMNHVVLQFVQVTGHSCVLDVAPPETLRT